MSTPTNSEPRGFNVEVDGGQGVQIGTGNYQFNRYLIVQIDAAAAAGGAAAAGVKQVSDENVTWVIPRTREQLDKVANDRPLAWEYRLFAGALIVEMTELDSRYRDYVLGYAPRGAAPVYDSNFIEFYQIQLGELIRISSFFQQVFSTQAVDEAIGPRGVSGDPVKILHLAKRYISVYDELLRWTERLRGTPVSRKYQKLIDIISRYPEQPIAEIRRFVNYYAEQIEQIPAALKAGKSVRLQIHVNFEVAPELSRELNAEFARLKAALTQ
jgi:hypothetical protein